MEEEYKIMANSDIELLYQFLGGIKSDLESIQSSKEVSGLFKLAIRSVNREIDATIAFCNKAFDDMVE